MARKPDCTPKTAYDVRRYLTLVQVIARSGHNEPVLALCEAWGIEPITDPTAPDCVLMWPTLIRLAQHVVEYHSAESK